MMEEFHKSASEEFADPTNPVAMGAGESGGDSTASLPGASKKWSSVLSKPAWAMIGVFIAGAALVGGLCLRSAPAKATATDQDVEQKVDLFISQSQQQQVSSVQSLKETRKVVDDFTNFASRHQVPVSELKTNPFIFGKSQSVPSQGAEGLTPRRLSELQSECAKLKLQSTLAGPRGGTAIINSNFVGVGYKIGPFTVKAIHPQSVDLSCEGATFTLHLEQQ